MRTRSHKGVSITANSVTKLSIHAASTNSTPPPSSPGDQSPIVRRTLYSFFISTNMPHSLYLNKCACIIAPLAISEWVLAWGSRADDTRGGPRTHSPPTIKDPLLCVNNSEITEGSAVATSGFLSRVTKSARRWRKIRNGPGPKFSARRSVWLYASQSALAGSFVARYVLLVFPVCL